MIDFGFYNMDCMEGMKQFPDGYFELAIVDPPYGIGYDTKAKKTAEKKSKNGAAKKRIYHTSGWDVKPSKEYFQELQRVSKNQIIWGGNYFSDYLPPSRCFICWDKRCSGLVRSFADCEYAWGSPSLGVARMFRFVWDGMIQENMSNKEERIHPTQKPVALYEWILGKYAKRGDKILDTHAGSASSLVACYNMGFDFVGFEIDEAYYKMAKERLDNAMAQIRMDI